MGMALEFVDLMIDSTQRQGQSQSLRSSSWHLPEHECIQQRHGRSFTPCTTQMVLVTVATGNAKVHSIGQEPDQGECIQ